MSKVDEDSKSSLTVSFGILVQVWMKTLKAVLQSGDYAEVHYRCIIDRTSGVLYA